jgi:hypothetical protein
MESDSVFQMGHKKITPMTAFGTLFKVEILSRKHWLSTWPMTLQSKGLILYMNSNRMMAGVSGVGVCVCVCVG